GGCAARHRVLAALDEVHQENSTAFLEGDGWEPGHCEQPNARGAGVGVVAAVGEPCAWEGAAGPRRTGGKIKQTRMIRNMLTCHDAASRRRKSARQRWNAALP